LIWVETPTNPTLRIIDIPKLARLAASHPAHPFILVDNTFLSPYYSSPLLLGADIVLHSITKYINGHSDVVMGAVILPNPATHSQPERLTKWAARIQFLQNAIGAVPSAWDCWLAMRGAKTLGLRMKAHGQNALRVAAFLESRVASGEVKNVVYPGLRTHKDFALVKTLLSPHAKKWIEGSGAETEFGIPYGGMVSFRIKGDDGAAERFLVKSKYFALAESLGGVESLGEVPEGMTHGSIPPAERALLGIGPDLVRLSVGVEEIEDLLEDVEQALHWAVTGWKEEATVDAESRP